MKRTVLYVMIFLLFASCNKDESVDVYGDVKTENGAIQSPFSVSANKQVYFSQGNLQYQASTNTWRFAENQYEMIGDDNANMSSTYSGWIDLFGWGTSGWNSGSNAYQPYSISTRNEDYHDNNLTGSYANADWGVYNAISNGGNIAGMWRTLTLEEWSYLAYKRSNASNLRGIAVVNGVTGLVFLPDNWSNPTSVSFDCKADDWRLNSYTLDGWNVMQSYGAVFLPTSGTRLGVQVSYAGSTGSYWASTLNENDSYYVGRFYFEYNYISASFYDPCCGYSVRLVQDIEG